MTYYYLVIALQAGCIIHIIRSRKEYTWIFLIIFLPFIGSLIYIGMELLSGRKLESIPDDLADNIIPSRKVKQLEKQLSFSDTFDNRVALADAYLASNRAEEAIVLYEQSLTGVFSDDPHTTSQLARAYEAIGELSKALETIKKLEKHNGFEDAANHLLLGHLLEKTGQTAEAEAAFEACLAKHYSTQADVEYALFLIKIGKAELGKKHLQKVVNDASFLSSSEKRRDRKWISMASQELKKLGG